MPKRPDVHNTLAQAYENIGESTMAKMHRRLAAESHEARD